MAVIPSLWRRISHRSRVVIGAVFVVLACVFVVKTLDYMYPPPIEAGRSVSLVVADREGRALRAFPVEEGRWRLAADLDRIDPAFIEALLAVEDQIGRAHV